MQVHTLLAQSPPMLPSPRRRRDAEGLTAESLPADLFCQLPAPGSEVYTRKLKRVSSAFGSAVALMPDGGVIVAGTLDGRMLLWRLDATGTPIAGWPKTIKDWTCQGSGVLIASRSAKLIALADLVLALVIEADERSARGRQN